MSRTARARRRKNRLRGTARRVAGSPARTRQALAAAIRLDPARRRRLEALHAYARAANETTPEDDGSLGRLRRCLKEDIHLLFEASLQEERRSPRREAS